MSFVNTWKSPFTSILIHGNAPPKTRSTIQSTPNQTLDFGRGKEILINSKKMKATTRKIKH